MPLTRWAASELLNDDVIDSNAITDLYDLVTNDLDILDLMINKWFYIKHRYNLNQEKFENKVDSLISKV